MWIKPHRYWYLMLRCSALTLAVVALPAGAEPQRADAAYLDWQSWEELPDFLQQRVPRYCGGAYRPPDLAGAVEDEPEDSDAPIRIASDSAVYQLDESMALDGNVRLRQGIFRAGADSAFYDQRAGRLDLTGNVISRGEGFVLTGTDAQYRMDEGRLDLNTASFLLHEGPMRGEASSLSRTGPEQLRISSGRMTTCQPGNNAWSIAASRVDLDQESGFGTARNVRLQVKDVPVFYVPWMSFPIDDRRKSGFLYPSFGTSNTGSGFTLATPYYFNLAPHYDMTYTPQIIHGRGYFSELEARHLSRRGPTELQLGFIDRDSDFADERPDESSQRWALDFHNRSDWGDSWRSTIDYAVVSDDDYVSDLNQTLDIQQTTHLPRQGEMRYSGDRVDFSTAVRGYQTLDSNIADENRPYSQLPRIRFSAREDLGRWHLRNDTEYNYFWRDNEDLEGEDAAIGSRLRTQPEVAWQLRGLPGFLRSSLMLDHTQYLLDDGPETDRFSRSVPFVDADAGLVFERDYDFAGAAYTQTLEPRLYYVYSPERDQDNIPVFDSSVTSFNFSQLFARDRFTGGDRVGDNNRLTTALTTRFYDLYNGVERAAFSLGQIHNFDDQNVGLPSGAGRSEDRTSPWAGEATLRPLDTLTMRVTGQWDERERRTLLGRSQLRFHTEDFRYMVNAGHTYNAEAELEQSDLSAVVPLGESTSAIGRWVYDMERDSTAGSLAGLEYTTCCWSAQLVAQRYLTRDDGMDSRILFQIQLRGLGGGGSAADSIASGIPGFEQRQPWQSAPGMDELRRPASDEWP